MTKEEQLAKEYAKSIVTNIKLVGMLEHAFLSGRATAQVLVEALEHISKDVLYSDETARDALAKFRGEG